VELDMKNLVIKAVALCSMSLIALAAAPATAPSAVVPPSNASSGSAAQSALPAGHPSVDGMVKQAHQGHPTTLPGNVGQLHIQAMQSTKGGPAIGADPVSIELYHNGSQITKVSGLLDEHGEVTVPNVPLTPAIQPLVRVTHAGVVYEVPGAVMDASNPKQELQVPVYQPTDRAPAWVIPMRHLMLQRIKDTLQVTDMFALQNPTGFAWTGYIQPNGARTTFEWPLAPGVKDAKLAGAFHAFSTKFVNGKIVNTGAMNPGISQYQVQYVLPISAGKAELTFTAPAKIQQMMVVVPDDKSIISAPALVAGGTADMGNGKVRYFKAADVDSGKTVKITIEFK
jgi:hypothetical protein